MKNQLKQARNATNVSETSAHQPHQAPLSTMDLKKIIRQLEKIVQDERLKREEVEEKLQETKLRNLQREKEFFRLIDSLKLKKAPFSEKNRELDELYNKILTNFDQTNSETNKYLEKRYEELDRLMERKIDMILSSMKGEIDKNIHISKQTTNDIKKEIKHILQLGDEIEKKNCKTLKSYEALKFQYRILEEEKTLLLNELILNKKKVTCLVEENQRLKEGKREKSLPQSQSLEDDVSELRITPRALIQAGKERTKDFSISIEKDISTTLQIQKNVIMSPFASLTHRRANSHFLDDSKNKIGTSHAKRFKMKSNSSTIQAEHLKCSHCHQQTSQKSSYDQTISHLKNMLRREKEKNVSLGNSVSEIAMKNKEINETLGEILQENQKEPSEKQLQRLVESEKLFKTLRILKRRLGMVESPILNCGWSSTEELLSESKNQNRMGLKSDHNID